MNGWNHDLPKGGEIMNSPKGVKSWTPQRGWNHELPKRSEIRCSGKSEHFLPHKWHPSRFTQNTQHMVDVSGYMYNFMSTTRVLYLIYLLTKIRIGLIGWISASPGVVAILLDRLIWHWIDQELGITSQSKNGLDHPNKQEGMLPQWEVGKPKWIDIIRGNIWIWGDRGPSKLSIVTILVFRTLALYLCYTTRVVYHLQGI